MDVKDLKLKFIMIISKGIIQFFIQKHCLLPSIKNNKPLNESSNVLPIIPIDWDFLSIKVLTLKIFSLILTFILNKYYEKD